jgi:maltokinase
VAPALRDRLAVLAEAGGTQVSRIHGDFHLGQLLRTDGDFAVIDFEGEPARPLAQRREPSSPLRDVAGMLRSLDYAARTVAIRDAGGDGWEEWLAAARATFLDAYGSPGGHDEELLTAFELEKACYEVGYEANNRPAWTWLPLDALERSVA